MDIKERENFNRNSTLIVEHTKEGFSDLIELNVTQGGYSSFENFINDKQHDIYHLCYTGNQSRCCQCPPGNVLFRPRILRPPQVEILLDKNGSKKTCHNPGRTADFCCCLAHPGLTTNVLDVTLARCLLVNFCQDVFWYSCLTAQTLTLEDFLTRNKHHIYHLHHINSRCCQCPPSYAFPTQRQLITKRQLNLLFSVPCVPCQSDRKRPASGPQTICASTVTPGITVNSLGSDLSQLMIDHCCPLKQSIEKLVEIRNHTFGHAKEARIPENEYVKYRNEIESNLIFIGQICNKQSIVQQKLKDLDRRTLDSVLLIQTIREQLNTVEVMSTQMSEESADIRDYITSVITQKAREITTQMSEESADIRNKITLEIAQKAKEITTQMSEVNADIWSEITLAIAQKATEITKLMSEVNADIGSEITLAIAQKATEITTQMSEVNADIGSEITLAIAQKATEITTQMSEVNADIGSEITLAIAQKATEITTQMSEVNADIGSEITLAIAQKATEITTQMSEVNADIGSEITLAIAQKASEITTQMEQHIDKKMEKFGQNQDRRQVEEKRKKLLETTKNEIKRHIDENTFVHTNAVNKALDIVQQHSIVILVGPPGIGKSRIGLELLRKIDDGKCQLIELDDISQWQDMCKDMDVVLIDDVFGRTNCNYSDDVHSKLLKKIFTTIHNMDVKVILTLRNNIYRIISTYTESQRTFCNEHVLDLSKHQMTVAEKISCLMNYFAKNNIVETDDMKKENIKDNSILDTATTVYLHRTAIEKILYADIGTLIGFPEACYLFASHRKFTRQGHKFFCHPNERLKEEIDNLRMEGDNNKGSMIDFTLLVYILLNGDSVNIDDVDQGEFKSIMETMYMYKNPLSNIPPSYINDSAERLNGKYLKINNEGNYCFQHRLISEAVMISYSSADPKRVIPLLRYDFITEMARPRHYKPSEGEVIFTVPKSCYSLLAQRILHLLDVECSERWIRKPYSFVQNLCKSKIITMTGNTILQEMITQYKDNTSDGYLESICDHRFSGQDPYYRLHTSYFYLPSALLMFCNIDNDTLYRCLYDRIHNTLTSEPDSDGIKACEETLVFAFMFAVCTLDVKKSTVILKILTDHNIKQDKLLWKICYNIVICQGLPAVQLLLKLHGLSPVFNITELLCEIFSWFCKFSITIDDNSKQFITSIIVNNKLDKLPVSNIVPYVCKKGQLDFVKDVCERFDSSLLDVDEMIIQACMGGKAEVIQWLMEKYDGLYNVQKVLNIACVVGYTEGVKGILNKSDHTLLDMKSVMDRACSGNSYGLFYIKAPFSSGRTKLIKWLCENVDNNLFDIKTMEAVMNKACSSGDAELVKWLCENVDNNLFDMKTEMNKACGNGDTKLVKWLCENVDNNLFDMKTGMNEACSSGNTGLVKWLCENVDNNLFDMKTEMNKACGNGDTKLVKLLCENVDNNLFDMKTGMNEACSSGDTELVEWLCENVDNNLFDMKTGMNEACSSGDNGLVKWLCENVDNNLFDMKTGMNEACSSGDTELVKWLLERFDNNLFDMKTGMNMACSSGNTELVQCLCEKFGKNLFDMKSAIMYTYNKSAIMHIYKNYDSEMLHHIEIMVRGRVRHDKEIIDWLFDNFDPEFFDIDSADYTASRYYHIDHIQFVYYTDPYEDSDGWSM